MRPSFEEVDGELVHIEVEFRLACHRTAAGSKRASSGSTAGASAPPSRPGSPQVQPRGTVVGGGMRQVPASSLAG